jgi:large subunit ribosomal protein L18Ae
MHQYLIIGRVRPTSSQPNPKIFRMKLFAENAVVARSRFWYYLSRLHKVKRATGEVLETHELFEKNPNYVKNFGFWVRYDSRTGTHNMYKEYRDTTLTGAVKKMYSEMASRHRARKSSIHIVRTAVVKAGDAKRANTLQFIKSNIKFRLLHRVPRASDKSHKSIFKSKAPSTFY